MKKIELFSLLLLLGTVSVVGTAAAATYAFSGGNFVTATGTYTNAMRVTGQFTVDAALAPNLPSTDITAQVTGYSFNDGVQTLMQTNSRPIVFTIGTDAAGNINTWGVTVWATPVTTMIGGQVAGIDASFDGTVTTDAGFTDAQCNSIGPGGDCNGADTAVAMNGGRIFLLNPPTPGNWTCSDCAVGAVAVPTLSGYAQVTLVLLLVAIGFVAVRRARA